MYLAKAKEHGFKPDDLNTEYGRSNAARYLLVNGLIPFTKENVELTGKWNWYISSERLPQALQDAVLKKALDGEAEGWEFDEEAEMEQKESGGGSLEGVWIRNGQIEDAKITRMRTIEVQTTYISQKLDMKISQK